MCHLHFDIAVALFIFLLIDSMKRRVAPRTGTRLNLKEDGAYLAVRHLDRYGGYIFTSFYNTPDSTRSLYAYLSLPHYRKHTSQHNLKLPRLPLEPSQYWSIFMAFTVE
jgi:hypothetical protein